MLHPTTDPSQGNRNMAKLIRSFIAPDKASSLKLGPCDIDIVGGGDCELLIS